jgi:hypothetical protein
MELEKAWQTYTFVASGRPIASYSSYDDAAAAIAYLEAHAPALGEDASIVARDVRVVTGEPAETDTVDAAIAGALSGSATGGVVGLLLATLSTIDGLTASLALYGLVVGLLAGAAIGGAFAALGAGRRREPAPPEFRAARFDIVATHEFADEAALVVEGFDDSAYLTPRPR